MRLNAAAARNTVIAARFEYLRDVAGNLSEDHVVPAEVVDVEINSHEAAERITGLLVAGVRIVDRAGDQACTAQVLRTWYALVRRRLSARSRICNTVRPKDVRPSWMKSETA